MPPNPPPTLTDRLRRGRWEVLAAYAAGGYAVLEAVDLFADRFGLPGWFFTAAVLLLILGIPLGLLLSRWLLRTPAGVEPGEDRTPAPNPEGGAPRAARHWLTWRGAGAAFVGVLALWGLVAAAWITATRDERAALELRATVLAELPRLADEGSYERAHRLALEAEAALPGDTVIEALRTRFSARSEIRSDPAGVVVYRRPYDGGEWERLGTTPLTAWLPLGASRLRFEKEGYRTGEIVHFNPFGIFEVPLVELEPAASEVPEDMVRVPGGEIAVGSPGLEGLPALDLADYYLDRHEVTNREYARFVEAGGYRDSTYWVEPFTDGNRTLPFGEAVARLTDRTGRPGPSTWEGGTYPPGTGEHPVGGLSWYEAAAYARFAGEALPTVYHWYRAAFTWLSPHIVTRSNYDDEGPAPAGRYDGMGRFGAYDMAGNVREWVWNAGGSGRYILGGGWNDEAFTFVDPVTQPAFDRSPSNGVRLARFAAEDGIRAARAPIPAPSRDYATEEAAGDEAFAIYRRMYDYDRRPLQPTVEVVDTAESWIRHRVTVDAAYGGERLPVHLYVPRGHDPPYQVVLFFPGSFGFRGGSSEPPPADGGIPEFLVRSGRAVVRPVLASTFERAGGREHDQPDGSVDYRDHVVMWVRDMRRAIDYAEEHPELDTGRLAYFGLSWGGRLGGLMVPLEPRFDVAVLYVAGLKFQSSLPEADPWNFLPRFETPVLMLNGRYDNFFPVETSQVPMFRAIATDPEHKRHVIYDGGHYVPRARLVRETLDWLDRYLGPVP